MCFFFPQKAVLANIKLLIFELGGEFYKALKIEFKYLTQILLMNFIELIPNEK